MCEGAGEVRKERLVKAASKTSEEILKRREIDQSDSAPDKTTMCLSQSSWDVGVYSWLLSLCTVLRYSC